MGTLAFWVQLNAPIQFVCVKLYLVRLHLVNFYNILTCLERRKVLQCELLSLSVSSFCNRMPFLLVTLLLRGEGGCMIEFFLLWGSWGLNSGFQVCYLIHQATLIVH